MLDKMSAPDRYFYIIEEENNTKYMHLEGNIYQNEDIFKLNDRLLHRNNRSEKSYQE